MIIMIGTTILTLISIANIRFVEEAGGAPKTLSRMFFALSFTCAGTLYVKRLNIC